MASLNTQNIQSFEKALRGSKDVDLDEILRRFEQMAKTRQKPFASSFILDLMKHVKYDPRQKISKNTILHKKDFRTAPTLFDDQILNVRVGIHIQSISNFQLDTMVSTFNFLIF